MTLGKKVAKIDILPESIRNRDVVGQRLDEFKVVVGCAFDVRTKAGLVAEFLAQRCR